MGGLINGSTVKGDLWMVEAHNQGVLTCFPVATTSEGPGPRVGHASLLVGNAFIVFGGDTKMEEGDTLDDTLYLLNICEYLKIWIMSIFADTKTSHQAMVESFAGRPTTPRPVRTHIEYSRQ